MSPPDKKEVKAAIYEFLKTQYDKKAEPIEKRLEKEESGEAQAVLQDELSKLRDKYALEHWMSDAAQRMAKQLNFATHISKGVHQDSKGSNIIYSRATNLPRGVFGSQSIASQLLDANGNAAALPLAAFFNQDVGGSDSKIRDVIQQNPELIEDQLSLDQNLSADHLKSFQLALSNSLSQPQSHELNKQLLWPVDASKTQDYVCITPLYPSVLTHEAHSKINGLRYSEANKEARNDRFKTTAEHKSYLRIPDLAMLSLGGTKPQNISQLMSKQGGRNCLLPSLPPTFTNSGAFTVTKNMTSLFSKPLNYRCQDNLALIFGAIKTADNIMPVRAERIEVTRELAQEIIQIAAHIQQYQTPGWSKKSKLSLNQKLWLDPKRSELEGEDEFKSLREAGGWADALASEFGVWVNQTVKSEFERFSGDFNFPERIEWQRRFEEIQKEHERLGTGVFS